MKNTALALLIGFAVSAPLLAQGTSTGRPGTATQGLGITLSVPSYVGSDVASAATAAAGMTKTSSKTSNDAWVVSLGTNVTDGSTVVRRLSVSAGHGGLTNASFSDRAPKAPRQASVDAEASGQATSGWRQFVERTAPIQNASASRGADSQPELVIYEVGNF